MSLIKQLWLAILLVLALTSVGSLLLSVVSSKHYLEKQLQMKNIDNATSLALSISQLPKDETTIGLLLSAQFDAGHYRYIGLKDPEGNVIAERSDVDNVTQAPGWFIDALTIDTFPAKAAIQDDWTQYGEITLESNINVAYDELWNATKNTLLFAAILIIISGIIGTLILRQILQPLTKVIAQSEAMKNHQFTHVKPPKTPEFKALVNAMNSLTEFVKNNIGKEVARLQALSHELNFDPISGLMTHDYFTKNLEAQLSRQNYADNGVIVVTRLLNLAALNKTLGYVKTNELLRKIGDIIQQYAAQKDSKLIGRLSGSDFAFFHHHLNHSYEMAGELRTMLAEINANNHDFTDIQFMFLSLEIAQNLNTDGLYAEIDTLFTQTLSILSDAEINQHNIIHIQQNTNHANSANEDVLSEHFIDALNHERLNIALFPVVDCDNQLIHYECPVRMQLQTNGDWLNAGKFINTAIKLNLLDKIDILVLKNALQLLKTAHRALSINVSAASILSANFIKQTNDLLAQNTDVSANICFEITEENVFNHLDDFRAFCKTVKQYRCKVAVEHVGLQMTRLGELHDIGLDFIKIDQSVIRAIDTEEANQTLLSGLCIIAHGIGVKAIAEGVKTQNEINSLKRLGFDGMTGPAIVEKT